MRKVMARRQGDGSIESFWLEDDDPLPELPESSHAWEVEERVQWDDGGEQEASMIALVRRLPSLTREDFAAHWSERHAPLARRHHPALRRYVQNVVVRSLGDSPEIDGVAELWFDSEEDMKTRFYDSPRGREIIAEDVRRFIDRGAVR